MNRNNFHSDIFLKYFSVVQIFPIHDSDHVEALDESDINLIRYIFHLYI